MAKNSTFNISLKLLTEQFNKGLKNVQRQLKGFGNFVKGAFAIGSIVAFGRKIVETGAQFEDAMARVRAVSNATAGELAMMTKEAERLGSTTKYTAAEAAGALENLTRNGLSATDATTALSSVLKLAQANAIGLAEAADIITNTMNIFGLETKDTNRINDVLSATCANSATNITSLAEAIKGVGPIAKIMDKSIEETSAALGVLANRGITGSEAGKALGAMFQRLAGQTPKAQKALKQYGIDIDEAKLKTMSLDEILSTLASSGIGNSIDALQDLFGKNYASTIATLINNVEDFNKQLQITQNAAGTTERMFNQGVGSTENAIKSLQSAFEGMLNSIFKRTSGALNGVLKALTDIIRAFTDVKTRVTAIVGAIVSLLTVKLVKAIQKTREEALKSAASMSILKAGITTVSAAAKAAYAAMGGWVGILVTLGSMIGTYFVNKLQKANEVTREVAETQEAYASEAKTTAIALERLHKIAEDENRTLRERQAAIDGIKKSVKDYHAEISNEGKLIEKNKAAIGDYIKAIQTEMEVQAKQAALQSLYNKRAILETKLLSDVREQATTGQKIEAGAIALWMQLMSGGRGSAVAAYDPALRHIVESDLGKQLRSVNETIAKLEENLTPEQLEKMLNKVLGNTDNGGPIGPGGGGDKDKKGKKTSTPYDDFNTAQQNYAKALQTAGVRFQKNITKQDEYDKEVLAAQKAFIDAYTDFAVAIGKEYLLEGDEFQDLLQEYNTLEFWIEQRAKANKEAAEAEKAETEKRKSAIEALKTARDRYNAKESKSQVSNPWDDFSANPNEYRDEERAVEELKKKLENLLSTYDGLKDRIKDIGAPKTDEERELLKFWSELSSLIEQTTAEYQKQANVLGSKKAQDVINEKTIEQRRAYYSAIRNTSSAVGTLASNLQSLAEADWSSMSFADGFNSIANAIFGTVDAVLSVIDTFKTLEEVMKALQLAETTYAAASAASSAQVVQGKEAEATATVTATTAEMAAAEAAEFNAVKQATSAATEVSANTAKAVSGAAASQAGIPVVGPFLVPAAIAAVLAAIAASLPAFANGGIIQGNSKTGDKLLARVNAGEMILNKSQQSRLFELANGHGGLNGQVEFIIDAKQLKGVLRNYDRSNAKIAGRL